jgi:transposase
MLRDGTEFHDVGDQYFARHDKARLTKRLLKRLRDLGVEVEAKPLEELAISTGFFLE